MATASRYPSRATIGTISSWTTAENSIAPSARPHGRTRRTRCGSTLVHGRQNGSCHENTYHDETDAFLVRYPQYETLYWIDIGDVTEQKMELRFDAGIAHPSINWASEYEFDFDGHLE